MRIALQLAGCVLALGVSAALALPCAAQRTHFAAQRPFAPRAGNSPSARPQYSAPLRAQNQPAPRPQAPRPQARTEGHPRNPQGGRNGAPGRAGSNRDWNRPGGGAARPDRPPSANTPPRSYNNLTPQEKQRVLNNNRQWQNLSPAQRQQVQERAQVWQQLTPAQRDHIRNDVLPKWNQMPPDRKRAIQNRLGVLKNMPEYARNQHLNDPNFTRGMSEDDKSTLRDLSHLHVGGAPDAPNE
jgi:hypothetical protein